MHSACIKGDLQVVEMLMEQVNVSNTFCHIFTAYEVHQLGTPKIVCMYNIIIQSWS